MRRSSFIVLLFPVFCLGMLSCNSNGSEKTAAANATLDKAWAKTFIDSMNARFSAEIALGDSVALASHYWPDAELLLDNSEVVKSKDLVSSWGGAIRMGVKEMTFSTTDITGTPNLIIETGNYEMKGDNKVLLDRGKYVVIWENRDGQWKLYRDIGCTSLPLVK